MATRKKVVFPENIHRVAAEIRRQALAHPDKDPVVPTTRRVKATATKKRATARGKKTTARATTTRAKRRR